MKNRLTYFIALLLAIVTAISFRNMQGVVEFFQKVSYPIIQGGVILSCLFVMLTAPGSVASLRRKGVFIRTLLKTLLWGVLAMLISVLVGVVVVLTLPHIFDVNIINTPSDVVDAGIMSASHFFGKAGVFSSPFSILLSIVAVSYLFGYFMKPDVDVIKPAYIVFNSFTEVGFRLGRFLARIYNVALFFIGTFWLMSIGFQNFSKEIWNLIIILLIGTAILVFFVFPFMYLISIKFARKTAIGMIFSSMAVSLLSFFSRNVLFSIPSSEIVLRHENAIPKKNTASAAPILTLFTRSGVAFVSCIISFVIIKFLDADVSFSSYIVLPFICIALSVISGFSLHGLEVLFVVSTALKTVGVANTDYAMVLFAILPFVSSIASFIDTSAAFFGVAALGVQERELFVVIR